MSRSLRAEQLGDYEAFGEALLEIAGVRATPTTLAAAYIVGETILGWRKSMGADE